MNKLLEIMAALRDPQTGCPWDIQQTFETIIPYTLEEAYEVADAIEQGDMDSLKSELGDLLFQVVFYAQMARENNSFDFSDVVEDVSEKLIRRHPHVFHNEASEKLSDTQLHEAWEATKAEERNQQSLNKKAAALDGVAKALPALKRAQKLQKRAAREGFDWKEVEPVFDKIEEEIREVREAIQNNDAQSVFEEVGDLLFSSVNLARHLKVDAEESLRACNKKFEQRFAYIETALASNEREMQSVPLDELEQLWQEAKKSGSNNSGTIKSGSNESGTNKIGSDNN